MIGKRSLRLSAMLLVSGCASINPVAQPVDGYDAIKFRQAVQVRDHALNIYTFAAGATFVADRSTSYGIVYCGDVLINDDVHPINTCFGVPNDTSIVIGPGFPLKEVTRELPLQSFTRLKVRL